MVTMTVVPYLLDDQVCAKFTNQLRFQSSSTVSPFLRSYGVLLGKRTNMQLKLLLSPTL